MANLKVMKEKRKKKKKEEKQNVCEVSYISIHFHILHSRLHEIAGILNRTKNKTKIIQWNK